MLETMSKRRRARLATHFGVGTASLALMVVLYNGLPDKAEFAGAWRKVEPAVVSPQAARASASSADRPRA